MREIEKSLSPVLCGLARDVRGRQPPGRSMSGLRADGDMHF